MYIYLWIPWDMDILMDKPHLVTKHSYGKSKFSIKTFIQWGDVQLPLLFAGG